MAWRDRADRRADADDSVLLDGDSRERQVAHAPPAAARAHDAIATGDRSGVHDAPGARRAHRRSRRCGEVGAAMRARRERRRAVVRERARHLAWHRPQPSLGMRGGGNREKRQGSGHEGEGRSSDGKSGQERGGAHAPNLRPDRRAAARCARIGTKLVRSRDDPAVMRLGSQPRRVDRDGSGRSDHVKPRDPLEVAPVPSHQRDSMRERRSGDQRIRRGDAGFTPPRHPRAPRRRRPPLAGVVGPRMTHL